jgi:hypothetical protein
MSELVGAVLGAGVQIVALRCRRCSDWSPRSRNEIHYKLWA